MATPLPAFPDRAAPREAARTASTSAIDALYILSAGHSGSTLLNLLLGAHPEAVAVSELTYLPGNFHFRERCTCGVVVQECAYWREVALRLEQSLGVDLLTEPLALDLGYRDAPRGVHRATAAYRAAWQFRRIAQYARFAHGMPLPRGMGARFEHCVRQRLAVYDAVRATARARVVVDASKEYLLGVGTWCAAPQRTRLVLLVRDGRAVYWSNLKRGFPANYSLKAWQGYYAHALPVLRRTVPDAMVLRVRYEDLVADPASTLARICEFAGLEFVPSMLGGVERTQHVASGNDMRFRGTARIRLDDQWRNALPADARGRFEREAGALNAALGYA
jgi:hypothetical protein